LIATIVVWLLQSLDLHFNLVTDSSSSILAKLSGLLVPVMKPVGLGDWRICTSLISGFMAKESVVSSFEILFGESVKTAISSLSALCLLVFSLLYTPCVASIAAIRRELGRKWALGVIAWQCAVAWVAALIVHTIGLLIGLI
ncbi:MAG: ferrous iron transporter B, partial [Clostridia bacterium]|nr:ferrous iron transporter B [Clostridia bacterium]